MPVCHLLPPAGDDPTVNSESSAVGRSLPYLTRGSQLSAEFARRYEAFRALHGAVTC